MKKFLSLLVAIMAIFSANAAAVRGAYAYDLKMTQSGDKYTFSFKVSADVSNASIILTNKSNGATLTYSYTESLSPNKTYQFSISKDKFYAGDYTWAVSIKNAASDAITNYYNYGTTPDAALGNRGGVAIDFDSESQHYGYVYVSRAKAEGGIFRYYPNLTPIDNAFIFADKFLATGSTSSPYRIKANSGKLYIADYSDPNGGIFVYNPNNGNFSQMFQGSHADSGQWTNGGTIVGGSVTGLAFNGDGSNRKMYAFVEDYNPKNQLVHYNLGTADTWSNAPSKVYSEVSKYLGKNNVEIVSCEKGLWICQNKYDTETNGYHDENTPMFLFMDYNGNIKFNSNSSSFLGATSGSYAFESGIAIDKDMTRLAVAGGGNINYSNVRIYNISWNGDTPSLTYDYEINLGHTNKGSGAVEQIVFDPADNLLLFSRQYGLMAYTLKNPERTTVTNAPSSQVATGTASATFSQVTEGDGNEKKYSFDLKIDVAYPNEISTPINCYVVKATNEIINTLKDGEFVCLDANGNDITSTVQYLEFFDNDAAINCNNGKKYSIGKPCIAFVFENNSTTALPSLVWKNVDPRVKYDITFYATSDDECNLITSLSEEMVIPVPTWSLPEYIGFHKLAGDYSALATAEDQPLGSHRLINSDGEHELSNQVTISKANYFGTNGGAITPIRVTDNVLGVKDANGHYINNDWIINYDVVVKDNLGNTIRAGHFYEQNDTKHPEYAACYSNEDKVTFDILGLPIEYTTEIGEDGRVRNIYTPSQKEYQVELKTTYKHAQADNDTLSFSKTSTCTIKTDASSLPSLGISSSSQEVRGALFMPKISTSQTESHYWWNGEMGDNAQEGYYSKYYDALLLFQWNDDSDLNRYMGYYAQTDDTCYGHKENASSSTWTRYAPASVLTNSQVDEYLSKVPELTGGKIGYDGTNNWSALAVNNKQLPMKVHYVYGADDNSTVKNTDIKFDVTLTAEYPIIALDGTNGLYAAEDPSSYVLNDYNPYMVVLTVPTKISNAYVSNATITTGIEDVKIEGVNTPVEYYNLQGVKVANPSNGIFIKVQGNKASKVLVK